MSEEILINVTPQETRVALVENGVLQEVYVERTRKRGLVGNIFKGSVSRVLPGMQAAFIDVGLERTGFLHISDIVGNQEDNEQSGSQSYLSETPIDSLLREGQDILVQVVKDPLGTKGARLTTRVDANKLQKMSDACLTPGGLNEQFLHACRERGTRQGRSR